MKPQIGPAIQYSISVDSSEPTQNMSKQNTHWQFEISKSVRFGRGARHQLQSELASQSLRRPFVILDSTLSELPIVSNFLSDLAADYSLTIFDGCKPEPSIDVALDAIQQGLKTEQKIDSVIGIGGGSNLDVAKIVAVVLQHGSQPQDYFGFDKVPGPVLPVFSLPTTAGTGSEVSHSAVLTDSENAVKVSTLSRWLRPTAAIVDPELTDSCPPKVTADSGIDALVHAIESYTNRKFSEMVDIDPQAKAYEGSYGFTGLLAGEAIRLIGRSLVPSVRAARGQLSPEAQKLARDEMAWGACLAGMAFSNSGVGIVHALEYPIGALTKCGHGEGNGLLLPHVMQYNMPSRQEEFRNIARWLGAEVQGLSHRATAEAAITAVQQLQTSIGIPTRLQELGLRKEQIPEVAEKAFEIKRLMEINPQRVELKHLVSILESAF